MTRKRPSFQCAKTLKTPIKTLQQQPLKFTPAICPLNLEEQKERFLKLGKLPQFILKGSEDEIEQLYNHERNQIRFDLYGEAEHILHTVREKYGDGENFLTAAYGERITKDEANEILAQYLKENNLDGAMSIIWCTDLASSARMMWIGPHAKLNRPEARNYSFWIKNSDDNQFIRSAGIRCLADHEIGTHFFRSFNDGLQPWYSDRRRWGIRGLQSLEQLRTEEGLAAINTILNAKARYLWGPAMLYYTACKAAEMSFKQLFDHLAQFIASPDNRWRHCMRVKRGLIDPNDLGGYGKDQCYFEGAVEILRNLDDLDFSILMSGKMCVDEVNRCKRLARTDCLRMPSFMRIEKKYKKQLKQIAHMNGVHLPHPKVSPPAAYLRRLKRGRRIGPETTQQVRNRVKKRNRKLKGKKGSTSSSSESTGESEYEEIHNIINRNTKSCIPWNYVSNSHTVNIVQNNSSDYIENIVSNLDQDLESISVRDNNSTRSCRTRRENHFNDLDDSDSIVGSISSLTKHPVLSPISSKKKLESDGGSDCSKTGCDSVSVQKEAEEGNISSHNRTGSDITSANDRTGSDIASAHGRTGSANTSISVLSQTGSGSISVYSRTGSGSASVLSRTGSATFRKVMKDVKSSSTPTEENKNTNAQDTSLSKSYSFESDSKSDTLTQNSGNNRTSTASSLSTNASTLLADEDDQSLSSRIKEQTNEVKTGRIGFGSLSSSNTVLSDLSLMDSKSANQSPVFRHSRSDNVLNSRSVSRSDSVNSVKETGPEKFIYPEFQTDHYLQSECTFYLSTTRCPAQQPPMLPKNQNLRLLGKRSQSAANRITSQLTFLPHLSNSEISKEPP